MTQSDGECKGFPETGDLHAVVIDHDNGDMLVLLQESWKNVKAGYERRIHVNPPILVLVVL